MTTDWVLTVTDEELELLLVECDDDSLPWQYFNRPTVKRIVCALICARSALRAQAEPQ